MKRSLSPPKGYESVGPKGVNPEEVSKLYQICEGHPPRIYDPDIEEISYWLEKALIVVGIRDQEAKLVGVGFVDGPETDACLDGLAVHPDHRHRGLGKFLIKSRVKQARAMGIVQLETSLAGSNMLGSLYEELGVETHPNDFLY